MIRANFVATNNGSTQIRSIITIMKRIVKTPTTSSSETSVRKAVLLDAFTIMSKPSGKSDPTIICKPINKREYLPLNSRLAIWTSST